MNQIQLKQNADFLSIAIETIETESYEVAIDFIEDVAVSLEDDEQTETLENAIEFLEDERGSSAIGLVEDVNSQLIEQIEEL